MSDFWNVVFVIFGLPLIIGTIIGIKLVVPEKKITADINNMELSPEFVKCSKFRKKDGIINKGACSIKFENDKFYILQDDNKIENDINSIYYLDIWDHKDDTYFKIRMRSLTEYIFKSVYFDADKMKDVAEHYQIKIEDNRK